MRKQDVIFEKLSTFNNSVFPSKKALMIVLNEICECPKNFRFQRYFKEAFSDCKFRSISNLTKEAFDECWHKYSVANKESQKPTVIILHPNGTYTKTKQYLVK